MADDKTTDEASGAAHQSASTGEVEAPPIDPRIPVMNVKVYAPFKVYFEGQAVSVTAENETGPFDILPHHKNFLCMLVPCDLIVRTPYKEEKTIHVSRALLHVRDEKLTVFVDV